MRHLGWRLLLCSVLSPVASVRYGDDDVEAPSRSVVERTVPVRDGANQSLPLPGGSFQPALDAALARQPAREEQDKKRPVHGEPAAQHNTLLEQQSRSGLSVGSGSSSGSAVAFLIAVLSVALVVVFYFSTSAGAPEVRETSMSTLEQVETMLTAFKRIDSGNKGSLDKAGLKKVLAEVGERPSAKEFNQLFKDVDVNGNGTLDFGEFLQLTKAIVARKAEKASEAAIKDAGAYQEASKKKLFVYSLLAFVLYWAMGVLYGITRQGWNLISCTYFVVVTLTTVGYGDNNFFMVDGKPELTTALDKYLGAAYVLIGVLFVSVGAGVVLDTMATQAEDGFQTVLKQKQQEVHAKGVGAAVEDENAQVLVHNLSRTFFLVEMPKIVFAVLGGACAMMYLEGWEFADAVYFVCVTMTTVGYGDLTPSRDSTKVFLIFYILISFGVIASSVSFVGSIPFEIRRIRHFCKVMNQFGESLNPYELEALVSSVELHALRTQEQQERWQDSVYRLEFVLWQLVKREKINLDDDVRPSLHIFDKLDTDSSGVLNYTDIKLYLDEVFKEAVPAASGIAAAAPAPAPADGASVPEAVEEHAGESLHGEGKEA